MKDIRETFASGITASLVHYSLKEILHEEMISQVLMHFCIAFHIYILTFLIMIRVMIILDNLSESSSLSYQGESPGRVTGVFTKCSSPFCSHCGYEWLVRLHSPLNDKESPPTIASCHFQEIRMKIIVLMSTSTP